jgi:hypothetical protein
MFSSNVSSNAPIGQASPQMPQVLRLHTHYRDLFAQLVVFVVIWGIAYRILTSQEALPSEAVNQSLMAFGLILAAYWLIAFTFVTLRRGRERRQIRRLFTEDYLAVWHYSGPSWQTEFEAKRKTDERELRNTMLGLTLAVAFMVGSFFFAGRQLATTQPEAPQFPSFVLEAMLGLGFLLIFGFFWVLITGLWRLNQRYRRAQNVDSAWVVFGNKGYYHQLDGITPLDRLHDVEATTDGITFSLVQGAGKYDNIIIPFKVKVPANIMPAQIDQLASLYLNKIGK